MYKNNFSSNKILYCIIDAVFLSFVFYYLIRLQYKYFYIIKLERLPNLFEIIEAHNKAYILLIFSWFIIADYLKLYSIRVFNYFSECIKKIFLQTFFFSIIVFTISGLKTDDLFSNKLLILLTIIVFVYLSISRSIKYFVAKNKFKKGKNLKNVLIVGENENTKRLIAILNSNKYFGLKVIDSIKNDEISFEKIKLLIESNHIKHVFISQSGLFDITNKNQLINYCEDNHINTNYVPYSINNDLISLEVNYIDTLPVYRIKNYPLDEVNNQIIKFLFDVIFSFLVCFFILSWLFPIIAILIKLDSKGDIIFKQKRRGLSGKEFDCYKFRTMRNDGTNSIKSTVVNDSRITRIGKFLRKSSLDELPQFFNVLKGDMSIVGPRPHMLSQDTYYSEIIQKYNLRNYVKPGITGLSQVKGFRGAISIDKDMEDRIRTDIFYVRNWSLIFDIQIIYQTIVLIFKGDENAI